MTYAVFETIFHVFAPLFVVPLELEDGSRDQQKLLLLLPFQNPDHLRKLAALALGILPGRDKRRLPLRASEIDMMEVMISLLAFAVGFRNKDVLIDNKSRKTSLPRLVRRRPKEEFCKHDFLISGNCRARRWP